MEFEDFCQKKERMCKKYIPCSNGCPLYSTRLSGLSHTGCAQWCLDHHESAEKIVDQWSKDNPISTNASKFKEVFGVDLDYSFDHPGYFYIAGMFQRPSLDNTEDAKQWLESEYIAINKEEQ